MIKQLSSWYDYLHKIGDEIFAPCINFCVKKRIHPNVLTLLALVFALVSFYFFLENHVLFIVFALVHLFFDIIDGAVARAAKKTSKLGRILDHYFVDIIFVFLLLYKINAYLLIGVMVIYYLFNYFDEIKLYLRTPIMIGLFTTLYDLTVKVFMVVVLIGLFMHLLRILKKVVKRNKSKFF